MINLLDTPVILVRIQERMSPEESTLIPTHLTIAQTPSINDVRFLHLLPQTRRFLRIDPLRIISPLFFRYETIGTWCGSDARGMFLEIVREFFVV